MHPFWPADNHWYYGDAVFIVEPLLWACSAPLLFTLRSRVTRALVALVLVAGIGLSWFSGLVPVSFAALLTLLTLGLAAVGRFSSARTALTSGIAAWLVVTAVFVATGRTANARVDALLADGFPTARTLDTVLTPMPANPVCREVLTVQLVGDRYVARSGFHSLAPAWMPAGRCAQLSLSGTPTAPARPGDPGVDRRDGLDRGAVDRARTCPRPSRRSTAPSTPCCSSPAFRGRLPQGDGWVVGDLRYDREPELGFAEVEVGPSTDECPRLRPPWVPPREDLLVGR